MTVSDDLRGRGKSTDGSALLIPLRKWESTLSFSPEPIVISTDAGPYTSRDQSRHLIRAVIGVAAFAGLREGAKIRGQWWEDDDGDNLEHQTCSVWRSHLKYETKTHEDEVKTPASFQSSSRFEPSLKLIIKPEKCIRLGWFPQHDWRALDLDNLADRILKKADFQGKTG